MNEKRTLSTTISVVLALALAASLIRVSAVPLSPYIMVVPEKTWDSTLLPPTTYTISIYTDYDWDTDIWSWQFSLTYNPAVLEGTTVVNGDLITTAKNASAVFIPGAFNNTKGELDTTAAFFDPAYYDPPEYFATSGPGTLAIVTFNVIGYGSSDITLVATETYLDGVIESFTYPIINGITDYDHLGRGLFRNTLRGDIQGDTPGSLPDGDVDYYDFLAFAAAYLTSGQPPYLLLADLQGDTPGSPPDGDVDYYDFLLFAANYLTTIP